MRVYLVITSYAPLRAFLFPECWARHCTSPYSYPVDGEDGDGDADTGHALDDLAAHVSSYSRMSEASVGDEGTIWRWAQLAKLVESRGHASSQLWSRIERMCAQLVCAYIAKR
jgi:hypothetical protein